MSFDSEYLLRTGPGGSLLPAWGANQSLYANLAASEGIQQVEFDQSGYTDEANPAQAASPAGGSHSAFSNSGANARRLYYRFPHQITTFTVMIFSGLTANTYEEADAGEQGVLDIHYIEDLDLDLTTLTWNNQNTLTYTSLSNSAITLLSGGLGGTTRRVTPASVFDISAFEPGGFNGMRGIRVMWNGDTAYSAAHESFIEAWPKVVVYTPEDVSNIT